MCSFLQSNLLASSRASLTELKQAIRVFLLNVFMFKRRAQRQAQSDWRKDLHSDPIPE